MNLQYLDPDQGLKLLDSKMEFGQLFCFSIGGLDIVLRPLKLSETESASSLRQKIPDYLIDDWIIENTLVYCSMGKEYLMNHTKAGLIAILANKLLDSSNLKDEKEFAKALEEKRSEGSINDIIDTFISTAFKNIGLTDLKNMTQEMQLKYLVLSESLLGKKLDLVPDTDPKTGKKRKKRSPEVEWLLSKEAADKPDFGADNKAIIET